MQNPAHYQHTASNVLVCNGSNSWAILLHTQKSNARSAFKAYKENDSYSYFTKHQNRWKCSPSNSNFHDSSQNSSISKAHTSGSNVVLASPPQPTDYRPNSLQHPSCSWGKNSFNVALNQTRYWQGLIWDKGGSSYLMELLLQQTLLHWFRQSLCFQSYPCKHKDKKYDHSHMLQ